jgi:hypothetical protein
MGADVVFHFTGFAEMRAAAERMVARANDGAREIVTKGAFVVQKNTVAEMGHRPGPNVITGTLARSVRIIDVQPVGPGVWRSRVAPTTKYGRRIELGFGKGGSLGIDSLGRHYHQPAFPSLKPGMERSIPELSDLATRIFEAALRG